MQPHDVKCAVCGDFFTTTSTNAKYCPKCRNKVSYRKPRPEDEDDLAFHTCDSPERIAICLNCPKPKCVWGTCPLIRSTKGGK